MAEYNWWDDRTVEENDNMMCPIINYPCLDKNCGACEDYRAFIEYCESRIKEER